MISWLLRKSSKEWLRVKMAACEHAPHTYTGHGTFTVRVTVGDTIGRTTEGFTTVVVP